MGRRLLVALGATLALVACGSSSGGSPPASGSGGLTGKITVLAAASLTESFTDLGARFEAAHPGTTVTFSFGASSSLATQIVEGAPADVFASASTRTMDQVVSAGAAAGPTPFATNVLQIAVPPANPAGITRLSDLARPGVKVVLCAEAVPCGSTARTVLAKAGLSVTPVSNEADVKAALAKVRLGEADAALVYVTDVRAAGDTVRGIPIPAGVNVSTSCPIAALTASRNPRLAAAFVGYVLSADGSAVLGEAGFATP
jgi:molybdate transport system substrate-binding protein